VEGISMAEPTPVTEDGEVIGLPPNPPGEDDTVANPEPPVIEIPPALPVGLVVEEDL
jgi:hypothetical protein